MHSSLTRATRRRPPRLQRLTFSTCGFENRWFDEFAKDWGTKNNISVTVDHIPVANVAARAAAEASAGSGHDLFGWNGAGGAHLYRKFLVDMTSLVESVEKKDGKATTIGRQIAFNPDDKTWSAFPDYYINFPVMYRKSLWDGIGMKPDSWDDIRVGGAKLKAKGNPPEAMRFSGGWPTAALNEIQARPSFQSSDRDGDGWIAQDELEHREKVVLISSGGRRAVNGQNPLSFLDGGDHGLII